jgi:hypothetical protein
VQSEALPGTLLSLFAAAGLSLGAMPMSATAMAEGRAFVGSDGVIVLPLCGDPGGFSPLVPGDDRGPRRDCPAGCHAMCSRRDELCDQE